MAIKYKGEFQFNSNFELTTGAPIDERFVVDNLDDLTNGCIQTPYTGLLVYVIETQSLYVLTATTQIKKNYKNPEYWIKIGEGGCLVSIDKEPTDGNGISISKNGDIIREYISSNETIESSIFYSSFGLNTFDDSEESKYSYIELSNGGESYIKLFNGDGGNWIEMHIVDETLGFSKDDIKIKSDDGSISSYDNDTLIPNGTFVCFGNNVDFIGFNEKRPNDENEYIFGVNGSSYEDVDIFKEQSLIDVRAYNGGESVKLLTQTDKDEIDDKISNIYNTLLIDPDGDGSENPSTLQDVIINMNNAINKLDEIDIEYADDSDIDNMDKNDSDLTPVINVKTLKYFRDKLLSESKFKVVDNKPIVEINEDNVEIATKDYVDDLLKWKFSL